MLTLPALRHSLCAAAAALLLVVLFVYMPIGITCGFSPLLPRFAAEQPWDGRETDLLVSVRYDGMLLVGPEYTAAACLEDALQDRLAVGPVRRVILQIDRRSPFASTRELFRTLQRHGIHHVLLNTGWRAVADTWRPPADGRN